MIRVANLAQFQLTMANIVRTQSAVAENQIQIATGKRTQSYSEIATESNQLVNLERSIARSNQFDNNIGRALDRLNSTEGTLAVLIDRAIDVKSIIANALSGNNIDEMPLQQFAATFTEEVEALLNTQLGNEYIFAGSLTDTQPVDVNNVAYTPQAGLPGTFTADADYYQGDTFKRSARADDNFELTYGITGDEASFEELLRTFAYLDYAGANSDQAVLTEALNIIDSAIEGLSDLRGQVGASAQVLQSASTRHQDFITAATNLASSIEDVDIAQATTNLAHNELQLQGSYLSVSRLRDLSLLNFLR